VDLSDIQGALSKVELFAGLDDELIEALAAASVVEVFEEGDVLIEQGTEPDCAWIVTDGEVELSRNATPVAQYGPGRVVGDLSLLTGRPHSVDAIARSDGSRVVLGVGEFRAAIRHKPEVASQFIEVLVDRIYHLQAQLDELSG
jgi:CRP-like cAMP-binding protein